MAKDLFNKIMGKVPVPADKTAEAEVEVKQEKQENVAKKAAVAAVEKTAAKQETADEAVAAEELEAASKAVTEEEPEAANEAVTAEELEATSAEITAEELEAAGEEKAVEELEAASEEITAEEPQATGEETAETEPKAAAEKKPKESEFIIETGRSNAYMIQNNKKNRLIEKIKGEIHFNMEKEDESEAVTEADKAFKSESESAAAAGSTKPYVKSEDEKKYGNNMVSATSSAPSQIILIDLVLDNTISMKIYYKILYDKLFNLINGIYKRARKSGSNTEIRYGITYIRDTEPIVEDCFSPNCFTKDVLQIMEKLKNITFSGGADNGRENINGAIQASLRKLHDAADENTKCGMLLFTDSLPEEEDMCPDFTEDVELLFAHCFVNDDKDYIPDLVNDTRVKTLEDFLNEDADHITQELISAVVEQVFVSGSLTS